MSNFKSNYHKIIEIFISNTEQENNLTGVYTKVNLPLG